MDDHDAGLVQQEPPHLVRGPPQAPHVGHDEQPALRHQRLDARDAAQAGRRPGRGGPGTRPTIAPDARLVRRAGRTAAASCTKVAGPRLDCCRTSSIAADDLGRAGAVADAPAGHGVGLRQAVDEHRPPASPAGERGRARRAPAVVDQRLVDLVAEDHRSCSAAKSISLRSSSRVSTVPTGFQGVLTSSTPRRGVHAGSRAARPKANRPSRRRAEGTGTGRPPQRAIGEA